MNDIVVKIKFGSHLYGTNTPQSDLDYKSVYLPFSKDIVLQRVTPSISIGKRSKAEGERNLATDVDDEAYSFQRYLQLLAEGQTTALDMLFAPEPVITSALWQKLQSYRERLLTKKSAAFVGYCRTQANKYGIKGSRVAAAKAAMKIFSELLENRGASSKVGDCFVASDVVIDEHTRIVTTETTNGHYETYFECCDRMVGFRNTLKEAAAIFTRVYNNYGDRARLAQNNEGIDWKALSHAVRVGREAQELLLTHHITFPLPYASHILDIKLGKLAYKDVAKEIEELLEAVEHASKISTLRDEPDQQFIDDLVYEVYSTIVARDGWM